MKTKRWIIVCCLALCLMGCGKEEKTYAETCWEAISYTSTLDSYLEENAWNLDLETLQSEAGNTESDLSRQFRAAALLCAAEYRKGSDDYPLSSSYVDAFLTRILTDEESFWETIGEVKCSEIFLPPMLNASKALDGELLVKLLKSIPEDIGNKYSLQKELDGWIEENPEKMLLTGDGLIASGYFDGWSSSQWKTMFFYNEPHVGSVDDALEYIVYLRDTILPMAQAGNDQALYVGPSKYTGEDYISTTLTIVIGEEITLQEPGSGELSEEIAMEGKKVAALYRNTQGNEFPDSPEPLRLIGDFMLNLPAGECPASIEEADYYLVLTPAYEYGDYYYYDNGEASDTIEVHSTTSVDLYEAGSGKFLRHLGNVLEEATLGIFSSGNGSNLQYPEEVTADILYYIYSHINEPDAYAALVDHIGDRMEFERDEAILIGQWEITYHGCEIVDAFETSLSQYTADAGNQYVKAEITITNRGITSDSFLPATISVGSDSWEDMNVYIVDFANETFYDCINQNIMNFGLFGKSTMEPGESMTGELVFEVPEDAIQEMEALYIAASRGRQVIVCPLEEE